MLSRTYLLRVCVAIGAWLLVIGCASLYQPFPRRIEATHLSCKAYPKLVDGNLTTTGILKVGGVVEEDNIIYGDNHLFPDGLKDRFEAKVWNQLDTHFFRYRDFLEGRFKVEVWIQLDTLTSVAYIEVHPVSNIYQLSVDTSTAEIDLGKGYVFEPVKTHKAARSENGAVIRINIDRPVRMLRIVICANLDLAHAKREPLTWKIKVPFEDIVIREIQVYR